MSIRGVTACVVTLLLASQNASATESLRGDARLQAEVMVVTPTECPESVRYAAKELAYHLGRATGHRPAVIDETAARTASARFIFLGNTAAARSAGIEGEKLPAEAFVLHGTDAELIIAGHDAAGNPLDMDTSAGTLFGVYAWLERNQGVRWLWPGDLGTYVPSSTEITLRPVDETVTPRFFQRNVRPGLNFGRDLTHAALGFTRETAQAYAIEQKVFLRRHRLGRAYRLNYGHDEFRTWWDKYGGEHPEWFQLVNGQRGPATPGARFSMCVSNPELHREIVARWKKREMAHPQTGPSFINAVDNDILGLCECDRCRAWDGPPPPDKDKYYLPKFKMHGARFVTDRYARFVLAVQQLAAQENPDVTAIGYAYFNYFQPPTSGVKLNPHILIAFSPSAGWYPRFDDEHEWYKKQWEGWVETDARVFFRPDYFLDGYCMPFIFAHQFADDFQHAVRHGCVATDFDSLTGQWAVQGPTLYLLMRLQTQPEVEVDELLAEYYAGFGPAAAAVKAYFDYWERYTMDNRPLIFSAFEDREAVRWRTWAKVPHRIFPDECFGPAVALLEQAAIAAAHDDEAAARVRFLRDGLTHAQLSARAARLLTLSDPSATPERGREALAELVRFRRAHERDWIGNFDHSAWVEDKSWHLSDEYMASIEAAPAAERDASRNKHP